MKFKEIVLVKCLGEGKKRIQMLLEVGIFNEPMWCMILVRCHFRILHVVHLIGSSIFPLLELKLLYLAMGKPITILHRPAFDLKLNGVILLECEQSDSIFLALYDFLADRLGPASQVFKTLIYGSSGFIAV